MINLAAPERLGRYCLEMVINAYPKLGIYTDCSWRNLIPYLNMPAILVVSKGEKSA